MNYLLKITLYSRAYTVYIRYPGFWELNIFLIAQKAIYSNTILLKTSGIEVE